MNYFDPFLKLFTENSSIGRLTILILLSVSVLVCVIYLVIHLINLYKKRNVPKNLTLTRYENNPVITPKPYSKWETVATFNPAAVKDDEGFVHLLYRAIGDDGVSRIGHAKSSDGVIFRDKSSFPVYVSTPSSCDNDKTPKYYDTTMYASGGSWGGCEDPRAVVIDGRVYMTYTAFDGWQSVRIALTSISMEDLKANKWNWKKPKFISSASEVNKNWVLFPEKVNGKFAVLHSISPEIKIDYIDDLDYIEEKYIKSTAPSGGRKNSWDNWMRGAGSPPVKTDIGWLLLYHAMDKNDPNKYKVGCMILDLNDPTKILYRSNKPLFEPIASYENDGKPGVVYASGSLILGDDLFVYYGGGDKNVCVAKTPLKPLLTWLKKYSKVT
jgi:predicted GH43/DUF377 family glycosyl hydrolase